EGACAVQVGEDWLIYFDVYREYRFGTVRTRDFQTFEPIDDEISLPSGHKHGTIIKVKESVLKKMQKHAAQR
ncbi:MAG: arabinosidase, partial [Bacteroidales bacterium]|nr:arabinosidase [Bacteroidales bacterium]